MDEQKLREAIAAMERYSLFEGFDYAEIKPEAGGAWVRYGDLKDALEAALTPSAPVAEGESDMVAADWLDKSRQYMQVLMTHAGNVGDEVAEEYVEKLSQHLDEVAKWYRWQGRSLKAFREKFGVPSNCQASAPEQQAPADANWMLEQVRGSLRGWPNTACDKVVGEEVDRILAAERERCLAAVNEAEKYFDDGGKCDPGCGCWFVMIRDAINGKLPSATPASEPQPAPAEQGIYVRDGMPFKYPRVVNQAAPASASMGQRAEQFIAENFTKSSAWYRKGCVKLLAALLTQVAAETREECKKEKP